MDRMTPTDPWLALRPVDAMIELRDAAREGRAPAREVSNWLADALADYLDGHGRLDELLGLRAPGRGNPSPLSAWRTREQDRALSEALGACGGDLCALSKSIVRFESSAWLRWRDRATPPPSATPTEAALFAARKIGDVPRSPRQLARRLRSSQSPNATMADHATAEPL